MSDRDALVIIADMAANAGRFDDVAAAMKEVVLLDPTLNEKECALFQIGWKNAADKRRDAFCLVLARLKLKQTMANARLLVIHQQYLSEIGEELRSICADALVLLEDYLIPASAGDFRSKIIYMRRKGDYNRYLAECTDSVDEKTQANEKALSTYNAAYKLVVLHKMPPSHPTRLELSLHISVLQHDNMGNHELGCELAKTALEEAAKELDALPQDLRKDALGIMGYLKYNLTLWMAKAGRAEDVDEDMGENGAEEGVYRDCRRSCLSTSTSYSI